MDINYTQVSDGYQQPLVKKNWNKSIDEGLGGSMLAIHNPSATDDGGHQYSAEEQVRTYVCMYIV